MNLFLPRSDNGPGVANRLPVLALGAGSRIPGDISYFASEFASGREIFQVKRRVFRNRCPAPSGLNPLRSHLSLLFQDTFVAHFVRTDPIRTRCSITKNCTFTAKLSLLPPRRSATG